MMTTRLHAMLRVRVTGAIHLLPPNAFRASTGSTLPLFLQRSNTVARLIFAHLTDRFKTSCTPSQDNIYQYSTKEAHFAVKSNANPTATVKHAQLSAVHFTGDSRPHDASPHFYTNLKSLQSQISLTLILLSLRAVQLSFFRKFNQVSYSLITEME